MNSLLEFIHSALARYLNNAVYNRKAHKVLIRTAGKDHRNKLYPCFISKTGAYTALPVIKMSIFAVGV